MPASSIYRRNSALQRNANGFGKCIRATSVAALLNLGGASWSWAKPPSEADSVDVGSSDIVVVAAPRQSSIDRVSYTVRDTAEARTLSVLDILGRLPLVEVTATGQVRLRGNSNVVILIDSREVSDPLSYIRSLQAGQIERVEVITNPSAQFAASGTAGVINIITRRVFSKGLNGSATGSLGTSGTAEIKASPTWARGPVSLTGGLNLKRTRVPTNLTRDRLTTSLTVPPERTIEIGRMRNTGREFAANLSAIYRLTSRGTLKLTGNAVHIKGGLSSSSTIRTSGLASSTQEQLSTGRTNVQAHDISLEYQLLGPKPNDILTISLAASKEDNRLTNDFSIKSSASIESELLSIRTDANQSTQIAKFDYVRQLGVHQTLSVGASAEHSRIRRLEGQAESLQPEEQSFLTEAEISGSWKAAAAYVTLQLPLFGGTVLPGLRFESRNYSLPTALEAIVSRRGYLFPTLHFERRLAKGLTGQLSYSRRVSWPGIIDLNPTLRFSDPRTANAGNPSLRPQLTDSFETKLEWVPGRHNVELSVYTRSTKNVLSTASTVTTDGVLITTPVNLLNRDERGASLIAFGPLARNLRYRVSADLADQRFKTTLAENRFPVRSSSYGGSGEIEYKDGTEGREGADRITFVLKYRGPINGVLYRTSAYVTANATWSHAFSDRLSGVVKLDDIFGSARSKTTYISEFGRFIERSEGIGRTGNVSVTYSFGQPRNRK